jgi:hypothetical protein
VEAAGQRWPDGWVKGEGFVRPPDVADGPVRLIGKEANNIDEVQVGRYALSVPKRTASRKALWRIVWT